MFFDPRAHAVFGGVVKEVVDALVGWAFGGCCDVGNRGK